MKIAVLKESAPGETRCAAIPETVKKFTALGAEVAVESGAGENALISNEDFEAAHLERLGSAVDGFVLAGSRSSPEVLVEALRRRPVVLFNREDPGFDCVLTDSVDGSRQVPAGLQAHEAAAHLRREAELRPRAAAAGARTPPASTRRRCC